ncbi:signal recognition particle subunit SRP19/SEC65 family protein [Candidatus Bathyarchaeota archaeon]|nr:signal recognition particle subunit SRP19/SEC65 family protein [Candidatus Bathyarchaeota archaeon]
MRKQNKVVVWPIYFDSTKTRGEGRKLPKKYTVPNPKIDEICEAVKKLGLKFEVEVDAAHPKRPWRKTGVIYIPKSDSKLKILKRIGEKLVKMRKSEK